MRFPVSCDSGALTVEVQGIEGDLPNGVVLASQTVSVLDLALSSSVFKSIVFPQPVALTAGTRYALVLTSSGSCGILQGPTGDPYPGGNAYYDSLPNPPGVWVLSSGNRPDLPFQTLMSTQ